MKVGRIVRINNSNLPGEEGLFGTVRKTLHGGAGLYVIVGLPHPYGVAHISVEDLDPIVMEDLEFVTVEGRYGVVLERKGSWVRIQFDAMVEWIDEAGLDPSSPEMLIVNDVMTR